GFLRVAHTLEEAVDRSSKIGEAVLYTLNQETYTEKVSGRWPSEY
ncbi:hypothetical protein HMPREF9467_05116, partial [, partial [[Clostridium] clostridioforme 2_1_49FAA]